jgi:hypothetical protein
VIGDLAHRAALERVRDLQRRAERARLPAAPRARRPHRAAALVRAIARELRRRRVLRTAARGGWS